MKKKKETKNSEHKKAMLSPMNQTYKETSLSMLMLPFFSLFVLVPAFAFYSLCSFRPFCIDVASKKEQPGQEVHI